MVAHAIRSSKIKHNYLNNKDILKEIHKSKNTYCSYVDSGSADYDMILDNVSQINKKNILQARKSRAERLSKLAYETAVSTATTKPKQEDFEIKLESNSKRASQLCARSQRKSIDLLTS